MPELTRDNCILGMLCFLTAKAVLDCMLYESSKSHTVIMMTPQDKDHTAIPISVLKQLMEKEKVVVALK